MRCRNNFLSDVYKFLRNWHRLLHVDAVPHILSSSLSLCKRVYECVSVSHVCLAKDAMREVLALIISLQRLCLKLCDLVRRSIIVLFSALLTCVVVIHGLLPTAMTSKSCGFFCTYCLTWVVLLQLFGTVFLPENRQNKTKQGQQYRTKQTVND